MSIQPVPRRRPSKLAAKRRYHVGRVDAIAGSRIDVVYDGPQGDVGGLVGEIDDDSLEYRAGHGVSANAHSDNDAGELDEKSGDDGNERHQLIDDVPGVDGPAADDEDANKAEQAYHDGRVVEGRRREQERERRPVRCEDCAEGEGDQARLRQNGLRDQHRGDAPQHAEVVEPLRVLGRVVRHIEVQGNEDAELRAKGKEINITPVGVVGHDARENAGYEHAER